MPAKRKRKRKEWAVNPPYDRGCELLPTDPRAAVPLLKAAAKRQPTRPRIHINLAWALLKLGLYDQAKAAAKRAHALDPTDHYVAMRRVHVLFDTHDDAVIDAARHALTIPTLVDEDRRYVQGALCWTLMRIAPAQAVRETELLVAAAPDHAESLAAHGCALAAVCRWDEGITWLDKAIAVDPSDGRFPLRRDQIKQARDAATRVLKQLRKDAKQKPRDAQRWRELGLALAKFAQLEEALEAFERARELEPINPKKKQKLAPDVMAALMVEATARTSVVIGEIAPVG